MTVEIDVVSAPARVVDADPTLSWSAVIAGAVAALAVSLVLTLLAAGFGAKLAFGALASQGSLHNFTPIFGAAAVAIQVISAALGGYLAGRLRHPWPNTHLDEAHFRDTAQGLMAWALATLVGVVLAVTVLAPWSEALAVAATPPMAMTRDEALRAANVSAQSAFFTAVGMLLSAFIAAVAGRVGGLRAEEMHGHPRR